ncbi:MAG TPA: hypothetical protein PKG93_01685 [Bacilli bacterium]|nr:hypothetical protein [Bacilli bacterium]
MDYYVDDIFSSISKDLKKAMKQKIKDIYPDMEELRRTFNNEKLYNIISKWYLDTINAICEKHIKRYPLKHFAIGYFHWTSSYSLPMYIYIRYPLPLYESFFTASKHTLDYLIRGIQNDGLLIKIVDNDNNIYFYRSSIKFTTYKSLDIMSYFEFEHLHCNWVFIYDDNIHKRQFGKNMLAEIQHRFNLDDCCIDYKYDTEVNNIVIIITNSLYNVGIEISIKALFRLRQIKDIVTNINNNKSSYDIIIPYCQVKHYIDYKTNREMNTVFQEEIIKYIYSARHLWKPLCEYILAEFKENYKKRCKWFIDIIDNLSTNPDVLFNDFYTAFTYFNELDTLSFTNIYSY